MNNYTLPLQTSLYKTLHIYYLDQTDNNFIKLENELVSIDYENRFGEFNSVSIDLFMQKFTTTKFFLEWIKDLRTRLLYLKLMTIPEWTKDKKELHKMQTKLSIIADNLIF